MRRWLRSVAERLGPERLAAVLTVPVVFLFAAVLLALVASSR
jgi:hypothetical protein